MTDIPQRRGGYYKLGDEFYPSVTTVLSVINKPAIVTWAAKTAAENVLLYPDKFNTVEKAAASIYQTKDAAAARGTEVHQIADEFVYNRQHNQSRDLDAGRANPYYDSIAAFFDTIQPNVLMTEATLFNMKDKYAGTTDLVADIHGTRYVIDYKTSKAIYPEMALQVEAYRNCDMRYYRNEERFEPLTPPLAEKTAIVLFRPNGTFVFQEVKGDYEAFLAAKRLWEWQKKTE